MIALALAAALLTAPQGALVFSGHQSCATWLSSPSSENAGSHWVLGFWSGKNMEAALSNPAAGRVGSSTDNAGVVGEVKLTCQSRPSLSLVAATLETYERFKSEGR